MKSKSNAEATFGFETKQGYFKNKSWYFMFFDFLESSDYFGRNIAIIEKNLITPAMAFF